jgi:hypothetical protein
MCLALVGQVCTYECGGVNIETRPFLHLDTTSAGTGPCKLEHTCIVTETIDEFLVLIHRLAGSSTVIGLANP